MALYYYKQNKNPGRKARMQNVEETFSKGMFWTEAPLVEGYSKTLVNFDIKNDGDILSPRLGLQMYRHFVNVNYDAEKSFPSLAQQNNTVDAVLLKKKPALAAARYRADKGFSEFILAYSDKSKYLNKPNESATRQEDLVDTLYSGAISTTGASTRFDSNGNRVVTADAFPETSIEAILEETWAYDSSVADVEQPNEDVHKQTHVVFPADNAKIHGMALAPIVDQPKHVGTVAYNEDYYFYGETGVGKTPVCNRITYEHRTPIPTYKTHTPKEVTAKEAVLYGYNMLAANPYAFKSTYSVEKLQFTGLLPYVADVLCMSPSMNQPIVMRATAQLPAGKTYKIVIDWTTPNNITWDTIKEQKITIPSDTEVEPPSIEFPFVPTTEEAIIRLNAYEVKKGTTATLTDSTLTVRFNFDKNAYGSTANIANENYSVSKATGLCFWKQRIVAWGVPEDPNILFVSDINDPTYFPYPNNVDTFTAPIRKCVPFQDSLLVFTSDALYMLTLSADGSGWTTKQIQRNLYITSFDASFIQVVKNMVFFKSNNYYFMIVPKSTSLTGELTIAAVSKPLYQFFDNFESAVRTILSELYKEPADATLRLCYAYNYLDFEDIHNVYTFQYGDKTVVTHNETYIEYVNLDMLYNTTTRTWRIHVYTSPSVYVPYLSVATQHGELACVTWHTLYENEYSTPVFSLLQRSVSTCEDVYLANEGLSFERVEQRAFGARNNFQLLDTGNREHNSNFKKRYREVQFTINNISGQSLRFQTAFDIDGMHRKDNGVRVTTDIQHGVGTALIEHGIYDQPVYTGTWTLNTDTNIDVAYWKCRMPVSGKGYVPRLLIRSLNLQKYELLNTSWVYKDMYSR